MIKKGKQGTPFEDPYAKLYNGVMGGARKLVAYTNEYGGTSYKFEDEMGDSDSEPVASTPTNGTAQNPNNTANNTMPTRPAVTMPSNFSDAGGPSIGGEPGNAGNTMDQAVTAGIAADVSTNSSIAADQANGMGQPGDIGGVGNNGVGVGTGGVSTGQNSDEGGVGYAKGGVVKTTKCPHCGSMHPTEPMGVKKPVMKMAQGGQVQTQPMAQKGLMAPAHYAGGGPVGKVAVDPAQDMEDSISVQTDTGGKAQLNNGEFVIPAAAVRQIGVDKLNKLVQKALEQSKQQEQITPPEAQQQGAPASGGLLQPGAPSPAAPKTATSTSGLLNLPSSSQLPMGMSDQMASIS